MIARRQKSVVTMYQIQVFLKHGFNTEGLNRQTFKSLVAERFSGRRLSRAAQMFVEQQARKFPVE